MQLSDRLSAVARMAKDARRLADIGTDHGYVPIFLALEGNLEYAVAMDVRPGPLRRAREHIFQYHLEHKIATRLSDGARALGPGEADTVVIAGMGGALTIRILQEGREQLTAVRTFVLQPQSEIEQVRRFLLQNGFCIIKEAMVKEAGKFYWLMKAVHGQQAAWEDFEYRYGKELLAQRDPCLYEYLCREEDSLRQILQRLQPQEGARIREREAQVEAQLQMLRKAKKIWKRLT